MEKTVPELIAAISPEEWEQVPVSVLRLIEELVRRMDKIEQEVAALRTENELLKEQLARTSANSSQPPSKNPQGYKPNRKEPTGKKRGGQIGHIGHERKLYPLEMCLEVIDHYPQQCGKCGASVNQSSTDRVYRHQIVEVPPVQPIVIEHRFHQMTCTCCGMENQAPEMVEVISQVCFQVILSRASTAAQTVLGSAFAGFITSDRCPAYNWVDVANRQLCWAHLKRDFIQISERMGASAEIGASLLAQEKLLFNLWHQFRNEQLTRIELVQSVEPIRAKFSIVLQEAAALQISEHEKTPCDLNCADVP